MKKNNQSEISSSGVKFKLLINHSLIYGFTSSLQSLLAFILLPILTAYYTTSLFGVYNLILIINALGSTIFYFGASSSLGRFYFDYESTKDKELLISTALIITGLGSILLCSLSYFFAPLISFWLFNTKAYSLPITIGLVSGAFGILINTLTLVLRYENKSKRFLFVTILGVLLNFTITYILLVHYQTGVYAPLLGLLISNFFIFFILITPYIHILTFKIKKNHLILLIPFGLQATVISLLYYIYQWIDQLIINNLLKLSDVGIYALGFRIGTIINIILIVPFSLIWAPFRMQYSKTQDSDQFVTKVISYYTIFGISAILLFTMLSKVIIKYFFHNPEFANSGNIFPLIMMAFVISGYQNILDYGIYMSRKMHFYVLIVLLSIFLKVVLSYTFIPKFGYMAAAYISLIVYISSALMMYFISSKYHEIIIEWKRVLVPMIFLGISYILLIKIHTVFPYSLLVICLIMAFAIIMFIKLWLFEHEKMYIIKALLHIKQILISTIFR